MSRPAAAQSIIEPHRRTANHCSQSSGTRPDWGDLDWDTNTVEPTPKDLARLARIRSTTVDMGAYEEQTEGQ